MALFNREVRNNTIDDDAEYDPDITDHLSDMLHVLEDIRTDIRELVNQNDKLVENSTRLTTLFERAERNAKDGGG